jgi:uncharacterized membrane protein YbaN (DUF454 family)
MKRCDIKTFVQTFAKEIVGAFFIVMGGVLFLIGILGVFLPLIPGIVFIFAGIALICRSIACKTIKGWGKRLLSRWSKLRKK